MAQASTRAYSITDYSATADFSEPQARRIIERDLQRKSYFDKRFGSGMVMKKFDTARFPFRTIITELLFEKGILPVSLRDNPPPLEQLHQYLTEEQMAMDPSGVSGIAIQFYDVNEAFYDVYGRFLREYVKGELFGNETLLFQRNVTIRFNFPNAKGFQWKPSYHTDIMLGHPPQEINLWFPLTRLHDSNTIRMLPLEDSIDMFRRYDFDFKKFAVDVQENPELQQDLHKSSYLIEGDWGDIMLFDSRCIHAMQENKTDITRVSIDIRVMPKHEYESLEMTYVGTGRRKMPFTKGSYYSEAYV